MNMISCECDDGHGDYIWSPKCSIHPTPEATQRFKELIYAKPNVTQGTGGSEGAADLGLPGAELATPSARQKMLALFHAIREYTTEREYQNVAACKSDQDRLEREMLAALDEAEKEILSTQDGSEPASDSPQSIPSPVHKGLQQKWEPVDSGDATWGINIGTCVLEMVTDDYQMVWDICDAHNAAMGKQEANVSAEVSVTGHQCDRCNLVSQFTYDTCPVCNTKMRPLVVEVEEQTEEKISGSV